MATYKVLQDIEAEDKLLGPLTLKQFIFGAFAIGIGYIEFILVTTVALGAIRWPLVFILLIPMALFGFLAAPIGRDQPNDIWLLARLRFLIKPHKRIWNQDGLSQLVTITAPVKLEHTLTNNLNQTEVKSRLQALASTLDSRGWAIKNVDVNMFAQPDYLGVQDQSDRLVTTSTIPVPDPITDVKAADDILDETSNPTAQHLEEMVKASTVAQHQRAIETMKQASEPAPATAPNDYWFLSQNTPGNEPKVPAGAATFQPGPVVAPASDDQAASFLAPAVSDDDQALLAELEAHKAQDHAATAHLKTVQPLAEDQSEVQSPESRVPNAQAVLSTQPVPSTQYSVPGTNPGILELAKNDDLNVATIARQAKRISDADEEVVVSLR